MEKSFEAFQDFIESLNLKFSAICLSETWLQPHEIPDSNFQLQGYYIFHLTREKNSGGGLFIFFAENLFIQIQKDLQVNSEVFDGLRIKVENKNSKKILC